ncbi:fibrinogen-like YCDxxxxGGGW domain-containing protein [Microterricola viridarii]|uniref:Fibrinogen C-terminal domain-containing protein n=1 Tax=Microterricola viridarii TaxID=412690 RepID=A0A0Y0N0W9_9MICO|nr:fibrinogen-like YCDxxxxGGGW domain-containing protein [Microterricola viridarii]AMB57552.1 hypothetical protein AWU67_00280 [Microterricola viridarii]
MTLTRSVSVRSRKNWLGPLCAAGIVVAAILTPISATAATTWPAPDGLSEYTAAASCWEVKQLKPSAPSGIYWLNTPALGAAEQFYCDQTTSGGGWLLIGRGREGWSETNEGAGTPAEVRSTLTGQDAFVPKQLSAGMIDKLLNNQPVKSMTDGVRLRRATNATGTTWQEATFVFASPRVEWSWMFENEQRAGAWTIGTASGTGGTMAAFGQSNNQNRIETTTGSAEGWKTGFGFGTAARGNPAANSFIWAPSTTAGRPRPFTQVYLRPKLMSSALYTNAIPSAGTAKLEQAAVASSFAMPTVWGVSGIGAGPNTVEGSQEVSAFAEGNGIIYIGGNFLTVQKTATGGSQVAQSYLAAFDVKTGEWIPSFRPTLDKQVKALAVLPNGTLAVGGYFSQVNGAARPGLVALNPTTGATDPTFTTTLINNLSGGVPVVRGLDVQGDWLYIGGNFTHMSGGSAVGQVYTRAAGRVSVADGTPDKTWNPEFNGTVMALDASAQGDRVYYAGFFTASKATAAVKAASIRTADTGVVPWSVNFASTTNYQQAVKEVGNKVWLGGSQHMLYSYDRASMTELSTNIGLAGGDFQAISTDGSVVYGGCHCFYTNYAGARTWPSVGTNWTQATKINSVGAWDNATGKPMPQFSPTVSQRVGAGSWALFSDSNGVTWFGGDYTKSQKAGYVSQWSGGFVRFAPNDSKAPSTPSGLAVSNSPGGETLTWAASVDNQDAVTYQVLRNDRVVATTRSLSVTLPATPTGTKYFVRAADGSGNWSASTPAATVGTTTPADPTNPVLVAGGSTWSYSFGATAPASGWQANDFDASAWSTGAAPIGWGQALLGTTLSTAAPQPLTAYYRKSFDVVDATKVASVKLTTRADDGIVVYVNGKEVLRNNIAAGPVTSTTYALTSVTAANALANPVTVTIPGSAFSTGKNVIAAEVHSNYKTTPSASFELAAQATFGTQPPVDPPVDPVDPGSVAPGTVVIAPASSWSYSYPASAPDAAWKDAGFDATGWSTGAAPIGWGQPVLGTVLTPVAPQPLTSYYRSSFTVADPGAIGALVFTTRADDGIVVYLNGVEVKRSNMAAGTVTNTTYASSAIGASAAVANPVVFEVPGSALVAGANVISAEVHSNYKSTPSASFELSAIVK